MELHRRLLFCCPTLVAVPLVSIFEIRYDLSFFTYRLTHILISLYFYIANMFAMFLLADIITILVHRIATALMLFITVSTMIVTGITANLLLV